MLTLVVRDKDLLEFRLEQRDETHQVRCRVFGKGRMLLLKAGSGSASDEQLTILRDKTFWDVLPGVQLKYYPNHKGVWKLAFQMLDSVKVRRSPGLRDVA